MPMNFITQISKKYRICAVSGKIQTKEPIKIEWQCKDGMFIITVDRIDYAVIDHVDSPEAVNLDTVRKWVEETYYDGDYKSSAYIPARLSLKEFKK